MANVAISRKDPSRVSGPRVRSGCRTCRTRHIKCDESRPSCQKCIHAGWTCDGYAIPLHKPKLGSIGAALTIVAMSTAHVKNYAIPFKMPGSQQDRRVLHYFCVQGCADIAGYFNSQFWDKEILQWCHREPVVRQALVALSSLHLNHTTAISSERQAIDGEILDKYGKALRALGRRMEQSDFEAMATALICCVLFYCVEAGLNNAEAAMRHLEHGLTILHSDSARRLEDFSTVGRVLNGLDLQATLFDDARTPRVDLAFEDVNTGNTAAFPHLDEAHHGLLVIENLLFRFLTVNMPYKSSISCPLPASVQTEKIQLMQYLHIWRQKFDRFWTKICLDADVISGAHVLLIHWHISNMLLRADYPADPLVFGRIPNLEASRILDLSEGLLERRKSMTTTSRHFSSESGIVATLFTLAMKCTDEQVRSRATILLSECHSREGLYESDKMLNIIQRFTSVRDQQRVFTEEDDTSGNTLALEVYFARELCESNVHMDRLAECLDLPTDATE